MIRTAGGDPSAAHWRYTDEARRYPQYANQWSWQLSQQFSGQIAPSPEGLKKEVELFNLLEQNEAIADRFEQESNLGPKNDNVAGYIAGALKATQEFFGGPDPIENLERASAFLDRRFVPYRKDVYHLRGITYEE